MKNKRTEPTIPDLIVRHVIEIQRLRYIREGAATPAERKEINGRISFNEYILQTLARLAAGQIPG